MVLRQVIRSRQNAIDFIRSNCYIVFFFCITIFSEAWWGLRVDLPEPWLVAAATLNVSFIMMLWVFDGNFRQYNHWITGLGEDDAVRLTKAAKKRGMHVTIIDKSYDDHRVGFAYLEEMVEMKLSC